MRRDSRFANLSLRVPSEQRASAFARRRRATRRPFGKPVDAAILPEDAVAIESESLRPDRRAHVRGAEIVGHRTRESFMLATGGDPEPVPGASMPAAEAHAGMLAAWTEKYGVNPPR